MTTGHPSNPSSQKTWTKEMTFSVHNKEDVTVVAVNGQLTVGNRQEFKEKVLAEMESGARKLLVDFSDTDYIDSSGLGVLVSISKQMRNRSGKLRLAAMNEDLRTLFELTKLDSLFDISESLEDALKEL